MALNCLLVERTPWEIYDYRFEVSLFRHLFILSDATFDEYLSMIDEYGLKCSSSNVASMTTILIVVSLDKLV